MVSTRKESPSSQAGRTLQAFRKTRAGGRPPVLTRCKFCSEKFTAREIRRHVPVCPARKK